MKKTFYIVSFILLLVAFLGCDKEPIDEVVTDDYLKGEPIARFELDGVTYVAKGVDVYSQHFNIGAPFQLVISAKDEQNDFNTIRLTIFAPSTQKGTYLTGITKDPFDMINTYTHASINGYYRNEATEFSTSYYEGDRPATDTVTDRGVFVITDFNVAANQIEGTFKFELVPPYDLDIDPGEEYPIPIKIENGYFKYINMEFYDQ